MRASRFFTTGVRPLAAIGLAAALAGCGAWQKVRQIDQEAQARQHTLQAEQQRFAAALGDPAWRRASQEVDRPWLVGRPQPLARDVTLPRALRDPVRTALLFPQRRVDLDTFAERVTEATGIPVRIAPEAYLPIADFMPRLEQAGAVSGGTNTVAMPDGSLPLPEILDLAAARLAMQWRYEAGALHFYRTESRVFNVRALLLRSRAEAGLGRTDSGGDGAFAVASQTRVEAEVADVMAAVTSRLQPLLTRAGRVAAHGDGSSLVVVTDTPEALGRIADFIDQENRALTRRVRLLFEEVSVALREDAEAGIDWGLIYTAGRLGAALAVPGAAGNALAGALEVESTSGPWQGSRLVVQALNRLGTVTRHTSIPLVTLNRRPVTHAVRTTFSWIDKVQTTAMAASTEGGVAASLPSVSVSQKEETVGQFLTLVPDAQADGQILLSIAYDTTVAQPLTTVTFGRGDNAVEIQQLTVDGNGTVQQVELRPGQPMIVSGFERRHDEANRQRLDKGWPVWLGGGEKASQARETTLVIITAMVEEGF